MIESSILPRRVFLGAMGASLFATPGLFAEQLAATPRLTEGPFYPDKLALDRDNDLIIVDDHVTPAIGEITHLSGRVLDASGSALKGLVIEIWQCDANAVYLHSFDSGPKKNRRDSNFQGFGRFTTDSAGQYRFRTIKPVPYPGRPAPHIHVKVKKGDRDLLTTQLFIRGHAGNERDFVFRGIKGKEVKDLVLVDFTPIKNSKIGELAAHFDVILGKTAGDSPPPDKFRRKDRRGERT